MPGWITFLSDYGLDDAFVGVCHGVIARLAPDARVIDVCHQIAPHDVAQGATTLASAVEYLPEAVHLAVVDPGVGTARRGVVIETARGDLTVGPDNGIASLAWPALGGAVRAYELTNTDLWLARPSKTFHGRDIFAPVAAHLALGRPVTDVGPEVDVDTLQRVTLRGPVVDDDHVHGEIRSVDHFGNLSLNLQRADLEAAGVTIGDTVEVRLQGRTLHVPFCVTFGEVAPGRTAVCEDSYRHMTIAVNQGNAARTLRAEVGDPVVIARVPAAPPQKKEPIGVLSPPPVPSTL